METTLPEDEIDRGVLGAQLVALAERLERALALEGLVAHRIALKVRYADGERVTRSCSLEHGVAAAEPLAAAGAELLERTQAGTRAVRLLGIAASALSRPRRDDRQLDLFARNDG
jgi:DNA polymerase-4